MKNIIKKFAIVLAWLALWQCISIWVDNSIFFVGPIEVIKELGILIVHKGFWDTIAASLIRIMVGFAIAFIVAYILAIIAHKVSVIKDILEPFVMFIKSVPVASIVVILLIWYGSEWLSLYVTFMVVFPNVYINMLEGLDSADEDMIEMAESFALGKLKTFRYIYRPAYMPHLIGAVKVAIGMSFKSGVAAEIIGQPTKSIGERIYFNKIYLNTAGVFAWTIVIIILCAIIEKVIIFIMQALEWVAYDVKVENSLELESRLLKEGAFEKTEVVLEHVTGKYGEDVIIDDFTYTFEKNKIYCIMGESGTGKTTLLNMIDSVTKDCKRVYQEDRLLDMLTGIGNVMVVKPVHTIYEVSWYMGKAGLSEDMNDSVMCYSGGMKRRVALLRALLSDSSVLLLDEPFTGLDDETRYKMLQLIIELQNDRCVIIATHNEDDAKKLGAEIIRL